MWNLIYHEEVTSVMGWASRGRIVRIPFAVSDTVGNHRYILYKKKHEKNWNTLTFAPLKIFDDQVSYTT